MATATKRYRDVIARMAIDPSFAEWARTNPEQLGREHGLSPAEIEAVAALGTASEPAGPARLGTRLSKSGVFFGADGVPDVGDTWEEGDPVGYGSMPGPGPDEPVMAEPVEQSMGPEPTEGSVHAQPAPAAPTELVVAQPVSATPVVVLSDQPVAVQAVPAEALVAQTVPVQPVPPTSAAVVTDQPVVAQAVPAEAPVVAQPVPTVPLGVGAAQPTVAQAVPAEQVGSDGGTRLIPMESMPGSEDGNRIIRSMDAGRGNGGSGDAETERATASATSPPPPQSGSGALLARSDSAAAMTLPVGAGTPMILDSSLAEALSSPMPSVAAAIAAEPFGSFGDETAAEADPDTGRQAGDAQTAGVAAAAAGIVASAMRRRTPRADLDDEFDDR